MNIDRRVSKKRAGIWHFLYYGQNVLHVVYILPTGRITFGRRKIGHIRLNSGVLYCHSACEAHVLAKASNSLHIPFGMTLKIPHVLSGKHFGTQMTDAYGMISRDGPTYPPSWLGDPQYSGGHSPSAPFRQSHLAIYKHALSEYIRSGKLDIYTYGAPRRVALWAVGPKAVQNLEWVRKCIRDISGMRWPIRISSRWYSDDRTSFHFLPIFIMESLPFYFPPGGVCGGFRCAVRGIRQS